MDSPRILLAALDWGLGHASRCIPVIRQLIDFSVTPVIGGSGVSLELLKREFPDLEVCHFPSFKIEYESNITWQMIRNFPAMRRFIREEERRIADLAIELELQGVISDNRYGLHYEGISSVLITHQLCPQHIPFQKTVSSFLRNKIAKFDHCWVPDFSDDRALGGDLSKMQSPTAGHITYLGPISRFTNRMPSREHEIDVLAILSGPEPNRTNFEMKIHRQLENMEGNHVIVRGRSLSDTSVEGSGKIRFIPIAGTRDLEDLVHKSKYIVARSGYSTIMDLYHLGRRALLIPTPGQAEQEYLAEYHRTKGLFIVQGEKNLDIENACRLLNNPTLPKEPDGNSFLSECIENWLESIY